MASINKITLMAIVATFTVKASDDLNGGPEVGQLHQSVNDSIGNSNTSTPLNNDAAEEDAKRAAAEADRLAAEETQRAAIAAAAAQAEADEAVRIQREAEEAAHRQQEEQAQIAAQAEADRIAREAEEAQKAAEAALEAQRQAEEAARHQDAEKAREAAEEAERQQLIVEQKVKKISKVWKNFKGKKEVKPIIDDARRQKKEKARLAAEEDETRFTQDMFSVTDEQAAQSQARINDRIAADKLRQEESRKFKQGFDKTNSLVSAFKSGTDDKSVILRSLKNTKMDSSKRDDLVYAALHEKEISWAKMDQEDGMKKPFDDLGQFKRFLSKNKDILSSNVKNKESYFELDRGIFVDPRLLAFIDASILNLEAKGKQVDFDDVKIAKDLCAKYKQKIAKLSDDLDAYKKASDESKQIDDSKAESSANKFAKSWKTKVDDVQQKRADKLYSDLDSNPRRGR